MICDELSELFELYALGLAEPEERSRIDMHLTEGCDRCGRALRQAVALNSVVIANVPEVVPPARLRSRLIAAVTPVRGRSFQRVWIGLAAAFACAAVWLGVERQRAAQDLESTRSALRLEQNVRRDLDAAFSFLRDPETRPASTKPEVNRPRGTYFVNPRAGVLLIAANLPRLAPNQIYQMWVIPKGQPPQPAGLFRPDPTGSAVHIRPGAVDVGATAALAISVEPAGGSSAPSTTPQLVTPVQGT